MDKPPKNPTQTGPAPNLEREARLAAALRTNLRRRKAAGRAAAPKPHETDTAS
jgi:hypothetical protein